MFSEVDKEWLSKEKNLNLDICKTCQDTDVPTKIIKEKSYIYIHFLPSRVNASKISIGFKASKHNTSFYEGRKRMEKKKNMVRLVFCITFQRYLEYVFSDRYHIT